MHAYVSPVINEALWIQMPGEVAEAHRVIIAGVPRMFEVDGRRFRVVPIRRIGGVNEDSFLAPVADLFDARPLNAAESAEYVELDRQLAGTIGDRRRLRAFFALMHRAKIYGEATPAAQVAA